MSNASKAWVWASYKGVVEGDTGKPLDSENFGGDRVVPFKAAERRGETMRQNATGARTKVGLVILTSLLIGAFFPLIALALSLIAILLIVSGKEPQKTEDFLAGIPGGDHVLKALSRADGWLS